jgi:hypothetical protein
MTPPSPPVPSTSEAAQQTLDTLAAVLIDHVEDEWSREHADQL